MNYFSPKKMRRWFSIALVWTIIFSFSFSTNLQMAQANPLGGTVVAGSASINSSGNTLTVNQNSSRAIINWQGFSINAGEVTRFVQPNSSAAILNRVTGGNPSAILGSMQSNGQVYLINPQGIVFGPNASINVGGLVASTLNVTNSQFMRGGDLTFQGNSKAGIYNYGSIRALEGDIYMIAKNVSNHGILQASHGSVGLLAGQSVTLVDGARPHLPVRANSDSISDTSVTNTGLIDAVRIELAANGGNVYGLAINNTGTIRATGSVTRNGRIYLTAPGGKIENSGNLIAKSGANGGKVAINSGAGGATKVSGKIDVSGDQGGTVHLLGDQIALTGATIDASGSANGGLVLVGGDFQGQGTVNNAINTFVDADSTINADAGVIGNGGRVIIWADDSTQFAGTITARGGSILGDGGFAEVSGKNTLGFYGLVDLSATNGNSGLLLLDPANGRLSDDPTGPNNIKISLVELALNTGTDVLITTIGNEGEPGNFTVDGNLSFFGNSLLEIRAHKNIKVRGDLKATGFGDITLVAGWTPNPAGLGFSPPLPTDFKVFLNSTAFDSTSGPNAGNFGNDNGTGPGSVIIDSMAAGHSVEVSSKFGNVETYGYNVKVLGGNGTAMIGSRFGDTLVKAKHDVIINGRYSSAQIGYNGKFATGDIKVLAGNDVKVIANDSFANSQIGHTAFLAAAGKIDVHARRDVIVKASDYNANAQIGHQSSFALGNIDVSARHNVEIGAYDNYSNAQIGHSTSQILLNLISEGASSENNINGLSGLKGLGGHIEVSAHNDVIVETGRRQNNAIAQIGHHATSHTDGTVLVGGNIRVNAHDDIEISTRSSSFGNTAIVGHIGELSGFGFDVGFDGLGPIANLLEKFDFGDLIKQHHLKPGVYIAGNIYTNSGDNTRLYSAGGSNLTQIGHLGIFDQFGRDILVIESASLNGGIPTRGNKVVANIYILGNIDSDAYGSTSISASDSSTSRIGHSAEVYASVDHFGFDANGNQFPLRTLGLDRMISNNGGNAMAKAEVNVGIYGNIAVFSKHNLIVQNENSGFSQVGHNSYVDVSAFAQGGRGRDALSDFPRLEQAIAIVDGPIGLAGNGGNAKAQVDLKVGLFGNIKMVSKRGDLIVRSMDRGTSQVGHNSIVYASASASGGRGGNASVIINCDVFDHVADGLGPMDMIAGPGNGGNAMANVDIEVDLKGRITLASGDDLNIKSRNRSTAHVGHNSEIDVYADAYGGQPGIFINDFPHPEFALIGGNPNSGQRGRGMATVNVDVDLRGNIFALAKDDITIVAKDRSLAHVGHNSLLSPGVFASGGGMIYIGDNTNALERDYRSRPMARMNTKVNIKGDIVLGAKEDITVRSRGSRAFAHVGHNSELTVSPQLVLFAQNSESNGDYNTDYRFGDRHSSVIHGDIKIGTLQGDVTFDAVNGRTQIGHRSTKIINFGNEKSFASFEGEGDGQWERERSFRRPFGKTFGDIIVIASSNGTDGGDINVISKHGRVHVGHFGNGGRYRHHNKWKTSNIVMVADQDFTIEGNRRHRALIGHIGHKHKGAIVLAWDQLNPEADNGGRFFMNRYSTIRSGYKNPTILIGTRRGPFNGPPLTTMSGLPVNVIEDGAIINGVRFDSGLPMTGVREFGKWNINTEFQSWEAEQWGFSFFDLVDNPNLAQLFISGKLKLNFGTLSGTFTKPFTFYYLDNELRLPPPIFDWNLFRELPNMPNGVGDGSSSYGEDDRDKEGEETGDSSYNVFQSP